jgi:transcriptional/translational regulatory protein YebC/TACO1|tara:strand:- start:918 stop:1124 length:207 start_codon:yes stop_codon:yes gene_type:complete
MPVKKKKKHQRARQSKGFRDAKGTVGIQVTLRDGQKYVKKNISKYMSIRDAKVSEIAAEVEKALFGDE